MKVDVNISIATCIADAVFIQYILSHFQGSSTELLRLFVCGDNDNKDVKYYGNSDVGGDNVSGGKPKNILGPGCSKVSTGGGANHLDCKVSSECLDFITIVL